jgi:hypothetical protein
MCQTLSNQINQQPLPFDEKNKKKIASLVFICVILRHKFKFLTDFFKILCFENKAENLNFEARANPA